MLPQAQISEINENSPYLLCTKSLHNQLQNTMRTSVLAFTFLVSSAAAFAPSPIACRSDASATALNLFGGKKEGGDNKGAMGGMMDQLAMFKKAQEIATKKQAIEKELQLLTFDGKSSNEKVTVSMKYMPSLNPMDPQPEFEVQGFTFDDEWYAGASPDDIAAAATEAYRSGVQATMLGSEEKFKVLAEDLKAMMAGK